MQANHSNIFKTLFVIGNGFDLFHSMNTKYSDFKTYLLNHNDTLANEIPANIDPVLSPNWSNFEEAIGFLDEGSLENLGRTSIEKLDSDDDYDSGTTDGMDYVLDQEYSYTRRLISALRKWIKSVPISTKRKYFRLNYTSFRFFTFNYTDTLESLYNVPESRIWHVHGRASDVKSPLLLGSNNSKRISQIEKRKTETSELDAKSQAIFEAEEEYYENTNKDVLTNIQEHLDEFKLLENISTMIVLGFSFGAVDLPYIVAIARHTSRLKKVIISYKIDKSKTGWKKKFLKDKDQIVQSLLDKGIVLPSLEFIDIERTPRAIGQCVLSN